MGDVALRMIVRDLSCRLERIEAQLTKLLARPNIVFNMDGESSGEESDDSETPSDGAGGELPDGAVPQREPR